MDPQQRLMLELGWEVLEDAGIVPIGGRRRPARRVRRGGSGTTTPSSSTATASTPARSTPRPASASILASRLSYFLGAHGPSLTVYTGQSSSLVARPTWLARARRKGESDTAIAGGVNLSLLAETSIISAKWGGLSPDGRCFTFDARANGYVRGEGGGAVLLEAAGRGGG